MKKYIIIGISLLITVIVILLLTNNSGNFVEGRVVDITYNENKKYNSNVMIHIDSEPYVVSFNNVDINSIELNDIVKIKTDGIVRESYPAQITGYSIKKVKNDSIKINDNISNDYIITFKTSYSEMNLNLKNRFSTLVFKNIEEFNTYIKEKDIDVPNNINELFNNKIAIVSYTNMTSSGGIKFDGLYKNNNMYVYLKLITGEITTTDIVTRGIITFVDKKYENITFETLTKYIIESN